MRREIEGGDQGEQLLGMSTVGIHTCHEVQTMPRIQEIHHEVQTMPRIQEIHHEVQTMPRIQEIHHEVMSRRAISRAGSV
jgi:hypothetical protein